MSNNVRIRKDYSKIKSVEIIPSLIEMQKMSYEAFLQIGIEKKKDIGLQNIFNSSFPICSDDNKFILEFVDYYFDECKYTEEESKQKGTTYALPLKIKLRLITNDIDKETGIVSVKDIKEQDMLLSDIPLMTDNGTFIVNGTERVIVSQIYRSPGVFFDNDKGKTAIGKEIYSASIIPHIGSWLDFEFDNKDLLYVKIDKRKKIPLIYFLKSLDSNKTLKLHEKAKKEGKILDHELVSGMSNEEILSIFYKIVDITKDNGSYTADFILDNYKNVKLNFDLIDFVNKKTVLEKGVTVTSGLLKKLEKENISKIEIPKNEVLGSYLAKNIVIDDNTILFAGDEVTDEVIEILDNKGIKEFSIIIIDDSLNYNYILNSLLIDKNANYFKSLNEIYKTVKLADAPNTEVAYEMLLSLFFKPERYNLSNVGRMKMNEKFGLDISEECTVLLKEDIIGVIKYLIDTKAGKRLTDDIDHLGNRRIRSVGELVENEIRIAFVRMERFIKERMSTIENIMPNEILNVRSIQTAFKDFFGTSQLSQFMDQTNPLSEITHKRRLSALGPKGLTRERASFEVRDVHLTHYGRICPIETPEGPNIGLINSLAVYARVNSYGFLETPYRKVVNSIVTEKIVYMTASQETNHVIAQAASLLDKDNKFTEDLVSCRINGELTLCKSEDITYIDISPKQLVSVAASLVPFLENDDANRALMGANMQRQAVPLLKTEAPIVGTGMESVVAKNSGVVILANRSGYVHKVDSNKIVIKAVKEGTNNVYDIDVYNLKKFQRSNHDTCITQKPSVNIGEFINKGDIIADGQSIDKGELALGKNVLVGFMPWNGYNFEDSILISEKIVKEDVFTSIHIEEFEVVARDTKLGPEEITADIPNVNEDAIKHIDESGIVYVGAEVKTGDILVGKVTPKAESVISAEEKLLRAIFGEKATDVKDTSLKVPSGISGTVIDVRVFSRRGLEKDDRTQLVERYLIDGYTKEKEEEISIMCSVFIERAILILENQELISGKGLTKGSILKKSDLVDMKLSDLFKISIKDKIATNALNTLIAEFDIFIVNINKKFDAKIVSLHKGDELVSGALKVVKVFVAVKRKLQPGDKMAGRHGNKGVVSKILPIEDMPHLEDGTPLDICLNPLGVPSRMNIGQILEVHLGWAAANVGKKVNEMLDQYLQSKCNIEDIRSYLLGAYGEKEADRIKKLSDDEVIALVKEIKKGMPVATSVFDGVKEKDINALLQYNNLDTSAQSILIDGRTGEFFERKVTVGYIYMLKLHHLVDEKIHARSIGPYSLITQQPLGGKAQFGGQRFGEMEVWALEAYGASYILREMLTVKSDDQVGRTHVYESIIKGESTFDTGIPESFNVLIKELRSLCLNLELKNKEDQNSIKIIENV